MDQLSELDVLARAAVREAHAQATIVADTEEGLAEITSGTPALRSVAASPAHTAMHPRRWWPILSVAAALIVGVAGVAVLTRGDERGRLQTVPVTSPSSSVPVPATTGSAAPTTTSTASVSPSVAVPATVTPTTAAASPTGDGVPTLHDADATTLYTAGVGAGSGQLGREACTECDPQRPLAPAVFADGTVAIPDPVNQRVVVVRDGTPSTAPGVSFTGADTLWTDAVLLGDTLFDLAYQPNGAVPEHGHLGWTTLAQLTAGGTAPAATFDGDLGSLATRLQVLTTAGGQVQLVQPEVSGLPATTIPVVMSALPAASAARATTGGSAWDVTVTGAARSASTSAAFRGFRIRSTDSATPELTPLLDGSVVVTQTYGGTFGAGLLVDQLHPDGSITEELIDAHDSPADLAGRWGIGSTGITKLAFDEATQTFTVQRFSLPTTTVPDLAGVSTAPATTAPIASGGLSLGQGLTLAGLPEQPTKVTHVESQVSDRGRTDQHVTLSFPSIPSLVVGLGHDDSDPSFRTNMTIDGQPGWSTTNPTRIGWMVGIDAFVELSNPVDVPDGEGWTVSELLALAPGLTYDANFDARWRNDPLQVPGETGPDCAGASTFSAHGGGAGTLVVFTCGGDLLVLDAATGKRRERIAHYDQTVATDDPIGATYVDAISISPDGRTVYFSTGPEPAYDQAWSYVLGSGAEPTAIGVGVSPVVSPDGALIATVAGDSLQLTPIGGADPTVTVPLWGMYAAQVRWSPDGTQLAFDAGSGTIGVYDRASGDVTVIGATSGAPAASWPTTALTVTGSSVGPTGKPWVSGVSVAAMSPAPAGNSAGAG